MISNTAQINTFIGGLDTDTDVNMLPNDRYRYAENVRVITNDGGTTGVLLNIEGVRKYSTLLPEGEIVIGTTTVKDIGVIITKLENGYNRIYRARGFDGNMPTILLILLGDLKLCEDIENNPNLSIVSNYESDTNIKIYFTDGNSPIKLLNIMSDKYAAGSTLVDEEGNILNPGALDITPVATLLPLAFTAMSTGSLQAGTVSYCYQLFNVHNTETVTSPLSEMIHLTTSTSNQGSQLYVGTRVNYNSNKSVTLSTKLLVKDYERCRIIRIHYKINGEAPTITIVDEIDITKNLDKLTYVDYGTSLLSELTIDEFNAMTGYQFIALNIAKMLNRLFVANITELSWNPKDKDGNPYDARAYRANSAGVVKLNSANENSNISARIDNDELLRKIDITHDCINPFNELNFVECSDDLLFIYGRDKVLGGYGLNIEYSFITTDIILSEKLKQFRLNLDCNMNVPAKKMILTTINHVGRPGTSYESAGAEMYDYRTPNYADPYIAANYRGYLRDEVYRFGIIFYNDKSIASPVFWIGDIRMPRSHQVPPFVYEDNTLVGKALGVEFKVKNMPEGAIAYEIVRCDRTESDRTIVMLATGSFPYEYRILELDGETGKGRELANSIEMRPMPYFSNVLSNIRILTDANPNSRASLSLICRDYFRLVSPEICVQGESVETLFKDNVYLDVLGIYYSPLEGGLFNVLNDKTFKMKGTTPISLFASAKYVLQPDGKILHLDTVLLVSFPLGEDLAIMIFPNRNYETNLAVYYDACVAKYYYPHYEGGKMPDSYSKPEIADAKYPPNISWEVTDGVTAYRINVGERTYTNYSMSDFVRNDNLSLNGQAGPCIIAHIPNLSKIFGPMNGVMDSKLQARDVYNAIPIFNIRKSSPTLYGGNTYSSRLNSVYITTSSYSNEESLDMFVFGGDTFLSLLDYPNTMIFLRPVLADREARKYFIGAYIPFESTINMNLFLGDLANRTYNSSGYLDSYLQLQPALMGLFHTLDDPYFLYNSAYSARNTVKKYVPNSMYAEDETKYSNRIMSSQAKTNNEVIDQWSKFKIADYLDVDNQWGEITNLKTFKDRLFYFLNTGLGIAAVNERALITDDNVNQLVLGTGGVLARYDYVTNTNGDSVKNDKSIINSDNVLYWYDKDKNEICSYTGQVSQLSKEKLVLTYLNATYKDKKSNVNSLFDKKYNEVWFSLLDKSLIFNEQLGRFTSFYTFNPKQSLPFSDRVVGIKDLELYSINDTNTKGVDNTDKDAKLEIVINKDSLYTKVFDNVRFQGKFEDKEGNPVKLDIIEYMKFSTKNLEAVREVEEATYDEEGNELTPKKTIELDYREDTYRLPIPRADKNEDDFSLPARMRGKHLICDYHFNGTDETTFEIPLITTTYRYSLI